MRLRQLVPAAVALLVAAALAWSLGRFGATPQPAVYRLFLALLAPALLACLALPLEVLSGRGWIPLLAAGLLILVGAALSPTLEGRGFVHLAIGWLGLALSLWAGRSGRAWAAALLAVVVAVGLFEAGFALLELAGVVEAMARHAEVQSHLAIGTLINPNHFAGLLNLGLALALGLGVGVVTAGGRRPGIAVRTAAGLALLAGAGLMAVALSRAESRGGTIALGAAAAGMALLLVLRRAPALRAFAASRRGAAFGVLLAAVLVSGLGLAVARSGVLAAQARADVYRDTVTMIAERPLAGVGPGMYVWRFRPYQTANLSGHYHHAHNDYLQTAAEWGVPAALVFWAFLAWRLRGAARVWLDAAGPWTAALALGACGSIATILVHSLVDFNLQIPSNLLAFAMVVGAAWSLEPRAGGESPGSGRPMPWWVARVLVPIALVGAGFGATRPLAALERAGPDPGVDELVAALELDGRNPEHQFSLGVLYRDDVRHHDPEAAREHLERAVALNPWAWRYHGQLARLYLQTGRPEEAVAAARRALELNPRAPGYHWALANTLLASGDREAAVAPLRFALERRRDFGAAALRLLLASGFTRAEIESLWPVDPASRAELARHLARYDAERDRAARRRGRGGEQRPPRRPGG